MRALPGAAPAAILCAMWAVPAPAQAPAGMFDPDFVLVNDATVAIVELNVSPIDAENWGANRLPQPLRAGQRFTVRLARTGQCRYDIRIVFEGGERMEARRENLCARNEWIAMGGQTATPRAPVPAPSEASATRVGIVNRSTMAITELFAVPASEIGWGTSRLTAPVASGGRISLDLPPGMGCRWSFRVVYGDGKADERHDRDVCAAPEQAF